MNINKIHYEEYERNELICCYRNCSHKIKEHNGKICKCKHITINFNVGFQPDMVIMWDK